MTPTAPEIIILEIIKQASDFNPKISVNTPDGLTPAEYYDQLIDDGFEDYLYDAANEVRGSGEITNLDSPYSRHYESNQLARVFGESAVSWTYWFGGGKHGEPEAIDWIDDAFFVKVEQKTTIVNVFSKTEG